MTVYESFGREYRRIYNYAAEHSRLTYRSESAVEERVADCVAALDRVLGGKDIHIAYLALSHVLEHHFMAKLDGR